MPRTAVVCFLLVLLTGCGAPEFAPLPEPPAPPLFGESVSAQATWYGPVFHGRMTDSGAMFDMDKLTASHGSLPFGTVVDVTNPENKQSVRVVINDRHNIGDERTLCISKKAAEVLGTYPQKEFAVNYMVIE